MLKEIEARLKAEGLATGWAASGVGAPMDQLIVGLADDEHGRSRSLWITPLPGLEGELGPGLGLVQFLVELPFKPIPAARPDLGELLLLLNNLVPLGAFGVRPAVAEAVILFRYVLVHGPDPAGAGGAALDVVLLISYLLDQFGGLIESIATGSRTLAQARADLQLEQQPP